MRTKKMLFILMIALVAASCSTSRTMTAKRMDIYGSGVIQLPVVADLEVKSEKITGMARSTAGNTSTTHVRNNAIANALKEANADILIEPSFETEVVQGVTTVRVTGFPGTYINFRSATIDDVPLLEMGILQTATVAEPVQEVRSGGSRRIWTAVGGIGATVLLIILLNSY